MKITKRQLKKIIREEKQKILETFDDDQYGYGPPIEDDDGALDVNLNQKLIHLWNQIVEEIVTQFPNADKDYCGEQIWASIEKEYNAAMES